MNSHALGWLASALTSGFSDDWHQSVHQSTYPQLLSTSNHIHQHIRMLLEKKEKIHFFHGSNCSWPLWVCFFYPELWKGTVMSQWHCWPLHMEDNNKSAVVFCSEANLCINATDVLMSFPPVWVAIFITHTQSPRPLAVTWQHHLNNIPLLHLIGASPLLTHAYLKSVWTRWDMDLWMRQHKEPHIVYFTNV